MSITKEATKAYARTVLLSGECCCDNNALDDLADALADLVIYLVDNATVTVPAGVAVATTGTSTAQTGETTAPGVGSLS